MRARRNKELFESRFPGVKAWLDDRTGGGGARAVVDEAGQPVNIDLGGGKLLPFDEPSWSANQIDSHRESPDRIVFRDPSPCNISPVSYVLREQLQNYLISNDLHRDLASEPLVDVGFLFVFGVGLGYQILPLLSNTRARRVILIEPFPAVLNLSLSAADWQEIMATADERGITIDFAVADNPDDLVRRIETIVGQTGNSFIEGSEFFASYYSWILEETYQRLKLALKANYITSGYMEDELCMMENTVSNLRNWSYRLIERRRHLEQSLPVILVGAGPSLDDDMEHLSRLRDRAIIVSCGTAIGILLKNGIRPHLHCELERGELVYELLKPLSAEYGLKDIILIASTTVDPRLGELFRDKWFFFRAPLSPSKLLAGKVLPLLGAHPLCCNAALNAMAVLGFKTFYLLGLDLGQRQTGRHHARDSVYYAAEHAHLDEVYRRRFDRRVPGNFGGEVETWWAFDIARKTMSELLRRMRLDVANCSDGARIDGARAKVAAAVTLAPPIEPVAEALRRVEQEMRRYAAGELLEDVQAAPGAFDVDGYLSDVRRFAEAARTTGTGFYDFDRSFREAFPQDDAPYRAFLAIAGSSVRAMIRLGHFFGCRMRSEEARQEYFSHFLTCFIERNAAMTEDVRLLFARIGAPGLAGSAPPGSPMRARN